MRDVDAVPEPQRQLLSDIVAEWQARPTTRADRGLPARDAAAAGAFALLVGASDTGKTMAAEWIANKLRVDLHRVDLSAVMGKYIGETEKNLQRLFDSAERAGAILFFDEAEALFGRRGDVKDSHDRYANVTVDWLLERMKTYRGVAVLATTSREEIDSAFLERIRHVVPFTRPAEGR